MLSEAFAQQEKQGRGKQQLQKLISKAGSQKQKFESFWSPETL